MKTVSRKERELREREARVLEVARSMLLAEGYHGLSMDRIAESLEYSKGTIYNHFSCKEEIIIALAINTAEKRMEMFQRAAAFRGRSRERMTAVGIAAELFVQLYPGHFHVEQILRSESVREKTSEQRRRVMRSCESRCISVAAGIVRDGISQGDLVLPDRSSPEDLVFGLWAMNFGGHTIITTSDPLVELGIEDPIAALRMNFNRFLDGCGWRPISGDHDYAVTRTRVLEEVFSHEIAQTAAG